MPLHIPATAKFMHIITPSVRSDRMLLFTIIARNSLGRCMRNYTNYPATDVKDTRILLSPEFCMDFGENNGGRVWFLLLNPFCLNLHQNHPDRV
ncbi:hypothetical protein CEXT_699771 [Caerostris extrusa]|uniref:Uncharacterized protein n=1 Tax=Caerostris extrusa TaxID=172846 RepID=A0AAV4YDV3_CAEEX|nr:hypothetical protein CEXT_699771 [Caerostris extrusa]